MKARTIDRDVLAVLSRSETAGNLLRLPEQLDRALYQRTNKVLEALGGKWNRGQKGHIFGSDNAGELVDAVLLTGQVELPEDFGFFPTPAPIVARMLAAADISPGMEVLEPSAGDGAIFRELSGIEGINVRCIELQARNVEKLQRMGAPVMQADFLEVAPEPIFDRVIMNPPFAKRADVKHVMRALTWLKPGGKIVAIMSAGVVFREDKLGAGFREILKNGGGTIEPLPPGSFKASGTEVNTVMVTIDGGTVINRVLDNVRAHPRAQAPAAARAAAPASAPAQRREPEEFHLTPAPQ